MSTTQKVLIFLIISIGMFLTAGVVKKVQVGKSKVNWQWSDRWNTNTKKKIPEVKQVSVPKLPPVVAPEISKVTSYAEALQVAAKLNKPIFIFFSASWCGPCKTMHGVVEKPNVKNALESYVQLNIDVDNDRETARKYNVGYLPTFVIINQKEETIKTTYGILSESQMVTWLGNKTPEVTPQQNTNQIEQQQPKMFRRKKRG